MEDNLDKRLRTWQTAVGGAAAHCRQHGGLGWTRPGRAGLPRPPYTMPLEIEREGVMELYWSVWQLIWRSTPSGGRPAGPGQRRRRRYNGSGRDRANRRHAGDAAGVSTARRLHRSGICPGAGRRAGGTESDRPSNPLSA